MSNIRVFPLVFGLILGIIATSNAEPVRGENVIDAKRGEYPFMAFIENRQGNTCSGALITKQHVLTDGHCLGNYSLSAIKVILASASINPMKGIKYGIISGISYHQWIIQQKIRAPYDIQNLVILRLSEQVEKSVAKPVSLSFDKPKSWYGQRAIIPAWDQSNPLSQPFRFIEKASVQVLQENKCQHLMFTVSNRLRPRIMSFICTQSETHNTINHEDIGGPLLNKKNKMIGVNLATAPDHEFPQPHLQANVHASLHFYEKFIKDVKKNY